MDPRGFRIETIEYASGLEDLRAVRETVFVQEQQVPQEEEWDALDPLCRHVIARDGTGRPIGTGRLTPEQRIGRMAVLREWRGKGVGDALLSALMAEAKRMGWLQVSLNAQVSAEPFYVRHGFVPTGSRFQEAGIEHQAMRRNLHGATPIENLAGAVAIVTALIGQAHRSLRLQSRDLDPGLFDHPAVVESLREFATTCRNAEVQILVHDAAAVERAQSPLLQLAQRLPSVFAFRETVEAADRAYASALLVNEAGGYYFRRLGHRYDGDADLDGAGRARHLREQFGHAWERSRPCTEFRALGI